jgi:hypothetical protein
MSKKGKRKKKSILDILHHRNRKVKVPDFDVEKTIRAVRKARRADRRKRK